MTRAIPERWAADSGRHDVARLDIPADFARERHFEISCRLVVRRTVTADTLDPSGATHTMLVRVDGALEWSRRVATQAGSDDSLELRLHRTVPSGRSLRLMASCELRHATRISLTIIADED